MKTYEDGLQEGKMDSLSQAIDSHSGTLGSHERRLTLLERICWVMFGIVATVQFLPEVKQILKALGG